MEAGVCDLLRECSQGKGGEGAGIGEKGELSKVMGTAGVQLRPHQPHRPHPKGALEHGQHHRVGPRWPGGRRRDPWFPLSVRHCGRAPGSGRAEATPIRLKATL